MIIYGAGMAGLLAANMLRRFKPVVLEAKPQLPQSHKAVLRFRSDAVSRVTGIPFQRVRVTKALKWGDGLTDRPLLHHANAYSLKVTGELMQRSITRLEPEERWIAPANFTSILAEQADIEFNRPLTHLLDKQPDAVISTIPMSTMAQSILELKELPDFKWKNILVARAELAVPADIYQTIYYPGGERYYRASVEGRVLILEMLHDAAWEWERSEIASWMHDVLRDFGIGSVGLIASPEIVLQPFGKIMPIDDAWRRNFIYELTQRKNVYSLGRFATWRQILLDDVVQDIEQIDKMMISGDDYSRRLAS